MSSSEGATPSPIVDPVSSSDDATPAPVAEDDGDDSDGDDDGDDSNGDDADADDYSEDDECSDPVGGWGQVRVCRVYCVASVVRPRWQNTWYLLW